MPCFTGTRITVPSVLNQLAGGWSLDEIVANTPEVKKSQVRKFLNNLTNSLELVLYDKEINQRFPNC